jgi:thymidine kinase
MSYNSHIVPGRFEVFCGPMYSGKTQQLIARLDPLEHMGASFLFLRPKCDKRRRRRYGLRGKYIPEKNPREILEAVQDKHELIALDEVQFFDSSIVGIIEELLRRGKNVVAAGLDLDFRGEPFGCMPYILPMANEIIKLQSAICRYPLEDRKICRQIATRTQRLIRGSPAYYNEPIISVQGSKKYERYEPRCLEHHFVPNNPKNL